MEGLRTEALLAYPVGASQHRPWILNDIGHRLTGRLQ